jgi:hypothetical protein
VCLLRFIVWSFRKARLQFTPDQFEGATSCPNRFLARSSVVKRWNLAIIRPSSIFMTPAPLQKPPLPEFGVDSALFTSARAPAQYVVAPEFTLKSGDPLRIGLHKSEQPPPGNLLVRAIPCKAPCQGLWFPKFDASHTHSTVALLLCPQLFV